MANTEDDLLDDLDKLQITPNLVQVKSNENNLPLACNPFFRGEGKIAFVGNKVEITTAPLTSTRWTALRRKARVRRASEGMLEERNSSLGDEGEVWSSGGVLKQSLKKSISSSAGSTRQRKLVLREPILKALQTCFRQQSTVRQSIATTSAAVQSIHNTGKGSALSAKGINDFRDLIYECHNLLVEDVEFTGQLNKLSLSMRNSKNFTTMQSSHNSPKHPVPKLHSNKAYQDKQKPETEGDCVIVNSNHQSLKSAINVSRSSVSASSSPEHIGASARCSTTCSQQAGSSAAAGCDDVTIDELASYFDTFVHIPKKMSSMAEMMYI